MADIEWIRLYTNTFDNPKIKKLRRTSSGDSIALAWVILLTLAGRCNADGVICFVEDEPYSPEDFAEDYNFPLKLVNRIFDVLIKNKMIGIDEDGFIYIVNWGKYQNADKLAELREYNRLAQQRSRRRRKQGQDDVIDKSLTSQDDVIDKSLTSQDDVIDCQGIEEEGEEKREKEIHSFSLSRAEGGDFGEGAAGAVENSAEGYMRLKRKFMGGTLGEGIVLMSDEQFDDLCERLSADEIDHYFGVIKDCIRRGKKFTRKTHHQAILDMAYADRKI